MRRALLVLSLVSSCARKPADGTPEGALDEFLSACESASSDGQAARKAFALLAPDVRRTLEDRARRAAAITGKAVSPDQLLVPSWTPIRFEVGKTATSFDPSGATATVDVYGVDPATQHVKIPMEREGESWRVRIVLSPDR